MKEQTTIISCTRIQEGIRKQVEETLATEVGLSLIVDDQLLTQFSYSIGSDEQLIYGHLISSGIIKTLNDIEKMTLDEGQCKVILSKKKRVEQTASMSLPSVTIEQLLDAREILTSNQPNHKTTRGFHGALLMELSSGRWFTCEDVGRHNAVDKVIGFGLQQGYSFSESMLLLSGRLTSFIVQKGVNSGIPVISSMTVATYEGIKEAKKLNHTLIGCLSEKGFWLYHEGTTKFETLN